MIQFRVHIWCGELQIEVLFSITLLPGWVVALEPGLDPERKSAGPGLRTQGAPCVSGSVTKRYVGHSGRHLRSPRPSGHSGRGDPAQSPPQATARGPRGPGEAAGRAPARPFPPSRRLPGLQKVQEPLRAAPVAGTERPQLRRRRGRRPAKTGAAAAPPLLLLLSQKGSGGWGGRRGSAGGAADMGPPPPPRL